MDRSALSGVLALVACTVAFASPDASLQGRKQVSYQDFKANSQQFTIAWPKSDWRVTQTGLGDVVFLQKDSEATVTIEHETVPMAYTKADITAKTVQNETDRLREHWPKVKEEDFKGAIEDPIVRPVVVIEYKRPSVQGGDERTRQYMLASGRDVYRIVCSAAPQFFDKYESVFEYMKQNFKLAASSK